MCPTQTGENVCQNRREGLINSCEYAGNSAGLTAGNTLNTSRMKCPASMHAGYGVGSKAA